MTNLADGSAFSLAAFFADNWGELLLIGMAAIKAALNLLPSEKPVQVFAPKFLNRFVKPISMMSKVVGKRHIVHTSLHQLA